MSIRKAARGDSPQLKEVKPGLEDGRINDRLKAQENGKAEFLIIESDNQIVSFVYLKYFGKVTHPDYPDMEDLFTKESERGKGYGTALIKECEKLSHVKGFKKIGLAVNPTENLHAKQLYEHLGYRHDGKQSYVDGVYNGVEDRCIDLEKSLV